MKKVNKRRNYNFNVKLDIGFLDFQERLKYLKERQDIYNQQRLAVDTAVKILNEKLYGTKGFVFVNDLKEINALNDIRRVVENLLRQSSLAIRDEIKALNAITDLNKELILAKVEDDTKKNEMKERIRKNYQVGK